ncbi:MAG TPA: L-threonylcarbamoyladenylate synthase [Burkholderiaceae bacterium]|nr:L-threonylcarbamoyladenylate synthase [Burkholderiaceae bacterium]
MANASFPVDRAAIDRAVDVLAAGGLVAVPTETVYGLAADADSPAAVRAIFAAKGRPSDHPVIVHVADAGALDAWSSKVPEQARLLAQRFWPGPLTLVLPRAARAHDGLTGRQETVGLRCPAHPWAQALLAAWCERRRDPAAALAAPSANSFGHLSPTTAAHVRADLGERPAGKVDLILDGGPCPVGIESTIVDLSRDERVRLLRPGHITRTQLEAVLGATVAEAGADAPRAPGRLAQHYAPRTPMELVEATALAARVNALRGTRIAVLAPAIALLDRTDDVALRLIAPAQADDYERRLYALLHQLDAAGAQRILVVRPPRGPPWEAVHDRLERARIDA